MKLHLTQKQMFRLRDVVANASHTLKGHTTAELLVMVSLQRLNVEIQQRTILIKPSYKMDWHPERCLAFYAAMEEYLPSTEASAIICHNTYSPDILAQTVVVNIMGQIHQQIIINLQS